MLHLPNVVSLCAACLYFLAEAGVEGAGGQRPEAIAPVHVTCVDAEAIGYATFQSHNQKVVWNEHGTFVTHLRTRNEDYTAQTWRLSRSTDGGRTFTTVYEATHATNPPVIETDDRGNVYLARADFRDGHAYLYRFLAEHEFRDPRITRIPKAAAGKYAMLLDLPRKQLYFFSHNNSFHILGLDGTVRKSFELLRPGAAAVLQYPYLALEPGGGLHAAWTTEKRGQYLYWDIHHLVSPDGGMRWCNLGGHPLSLPVIADHTGGALRITPEDEFEVHTWLSSFTVKEGKVHFLYLAQSQPPRQHYLRYDIASGKADQHRQPELRGSAISLRGLDGFFATAPRRDGSPLYCVGHDGGRVACLVSRDNGRTWQDFARSAEAFRLYAVGGCRELTAAGEIIGTFTDQAGSNRTTDRTSKVYFFRIPPAAQGQQAADLPR